MFQPPTWWHTTLLLVQNNYLPHIWSSQRIYHTNLHLQSRRSASILAFAPIFFSNVAKDSAPQEFGSVWSRYHCNHIKTQTSKSESPVHWRHWSCTQETRVVLHLFMVLSVIFNLKLLNAIKFYCKFNFLQTKYKHLHSLDFIVHSTLFMVINCILSRSL